MKKRQAEKKESSSCNMRSRGRHARKGLAAMLAVCMLGTAGCASSTSAPAEGATEAGTQAPAEAGTESTPPSDLNGSTESQQAEKSGESSTEAFTAAESADETDTSSPEEEGSKEGGVSKNKEEEEASGESGKDPFEGIDFSGLPQCSKEEYPLTDGSTACLPLAYALYEKVTGATEEEAKARITCTKTDYAYYSMEGEYAYASKLLLVYEPSDSIKEDIKNFDVKLETEAIGKDALVFLVNSANPVESVTETQLAGIYTGLYRNWSILGGENKEILAFQRSENSGSQTLMENLVLKGQTPMQAPSNMVPTAMGELISEVARYNNAANAIGYSVYYYAKNMYSVPGIRFLKVFGVEPTPETIADGSYPYVNDFYAVIREDEPKDSIAHQIYDWLVTEEGQKFIAACGYVNLEGTDTENEAPRTPSEERGTATYDLDEDTYIVVNGTDFLENDGIYIYDGNMEEVKHIEGLTLEDNGDFLVQKLDEPVIVIDKRGKYGLYNLEDEEYVLSPVYDIIYRNTQQSDTFTASIYGTYDSGETSDRYVTYSDGEVKESVDPSRKVGNGYWGDIDEDGFITVTDLYGTTIRTINAKAVGVVSGYAWDPYYLGTDSKGNDIVLNAKGDVVMSRGIMGDDFYAAAGGTKDTKGADEWTLGIYSVADNGFLIYGYVVTDQNDYDTAEFLYDARTRELLTAYGDKVEASYMAYDDGPDYRVLKADGTTRLYAGTDLALIATDGTYFEYSLDLGYYAYLNKDDSTLVIENGSGSEHYEIPVGDTGDYFYVLAVAKGIFLLNDIDGACYEGETKLLDSAYSTAVGVNKVFLQDQSGTGYLVDVPSGDFLADYANGEYVEAVKGQVVQSKAGDWENFRTLSGDLVISLLGGTQTED